MSQECGLPEPKGLTALGLISTIAGKEFNDNLRNRWLWLMTGMLLLLSLCVSFMGSAVSGELVILAPAQLVSGLATLSVFMLPLGAVLLSYDSFVGEKESGTLLLLLTYPLARWHIVCGKFLGHGCVMAVACVLGFGLTGGVLAVLAEPSVRLVLLTAFGHLIGSGILLSLVFVLLGYGVSLAVQEKAKALGILLLVWFVLVLLYDLVLLSALVGLADSLNRTVFNVVLLFNPTDLYRALNLLANPVDSLAAKSSLALVVETGLSLWLIYGIFVGWIALLLGGCIGYFKRLEM
ncbi:MAG: ABC transporter permease [Shewanella sp.]